jgi:hypothetical protein
MPARLTTRPDLSISLVMTKCRAQVGRRPLERDSFRHRITSALGESAMVFGLSLSTFTTIHVIISLIAIVVGFITVFGMFTGNRMASWTAIFLFTTILTSVTGFGFPFDHVLPSHIVGAVSLVFLAVAVFALYVKHLAGAWRRIYVVSAIVALWFNVFVLIAQSFQKISALKALAPTQSEPPFLIAQGAALLLFVVLGIFAVRKFRPLTA